MELKIRTGANISNILQSTVTYEQAFTELIKNSIQSGATIIDITLEKDRALIFDDGIGFDHKKDEKGMTGFDKYFVFGNSYDMSGGAGVKMGHMGIGGKISNDKLTDPQNPHWTLETKNTDGKCFHVEYKRGDSEFLDDYSPILTEVEPSHSNIKTATGTIVVIHKLDPVLTNDGWRLDSIKKEIRNFFGELVRNKKNIEIYINGESLKFDYALPGYAFTAIERVFQYEHFGSKRESRIKFNLSLLQAKEDSDENDTVHVVSDVKICDFKLSDQTLLNNIFDDISAKSGTPFRSQRSIRNTFLKMRGFINCPDLSLVLDHTGMPAKDLSHHALRQDHPMTKPFYECVYKTVVDLLRGYLLLNQKDEKVRHKQIAMDVINKIAEDMDLPEDILIDYDEDPSMADKIKKARIGEDLEKELIKSEIENATKNEKRPGVKRRIERNIANKYNKVEKKTKTKRGVRYEIKSLGEGSESIMADHNQYGDFCIRINSDNPKFKKVDADNTQMRSHIAELVIREILRFQNPMVTKEEVDKGISRFYED
jgi:hypothetical protein